MGVCIGLCIEVCIGGVKHAPFHEFLTPINGKTAHMSYGRNSLPGYWTWASGYGFLLSPLSFFSIFALLLDTS